jgi:hypothetical protein
MQNIHARKLTGGTCPTNSSALRYDGGMPAYDGWFKAWVRMTDDQLKTATRDYIWLAQVNPDTDTKRRNEIIAEVEGRGNG